jgi:hypothetical protein
VDDTFYSLDYARSFALAHLMSEGMRAKFGADWYGSAEAGKLIKTLVAEGNKTEAEDVAKLFGVPFDLRPAETRLRRLVGETAAR